MNPITGNLANFLILLVTVLIFAGSCWFSVRVRAQNWASYMTESFTFGPAVGTLAIIFLNVIILLLNNFLYDFGISFTGEPRLLGTADVFANMSEFILLYSAASGLIHTVRAFIAQFAIDAEGHSLSIFKRNQVRRDKAAEDAGEAEAEDTAKDEDDAYST